MPPRSITVVMAVLGLAAPAAAQTSADTPRATLNVAVGMIGSSSDATPGSRPLYAIGADMPLSNLWSLRVEAGRRFPSSQQWRRGVTFNADTTAITETSVLDAALLLRAGTPMSRRVQAGALAGLNLQLVDLETETWILPSHSGDREPFQQVSGNRSLRTRLDLGLDAGVRLDDRWTLTAYGLAGFPPVLDDNERTQLRFGVIAKRDF